MCNLYGKFYKRVPTQVQACQWFKVGDFPKVVPLWKGNLLKFFQIGLSLKGTPPQRLGWIETLEGGHIVTPSDWIIVGIEGEYYPCKDYIFKILYREVF